MIPSSECHNISIRHPDLQKKNTNNARIKVRDRPQMTSRVFNTADWKSQHLYYRHLKVERSVRNFEPRGIWRALESDNCRWAGKTSWLYGEKIQKWRKVCCTEVICKLVEEFCIICVALNFEPVKWFEMRSNVMEFWSFCDSTSSRVENELKPIELLITDVEIKRVTVV